MQATIDGLPKPTQWWISIRQRNATNASAHNFFFILMHAGVGHAKKRPMIGIQVSAVRRLMPVAPGFTCSLTSRRSTKPRMGPFSVRISSYAARLDVSIRLQSNTRTKGKPSHFRHHGDGDLERVKNSRAHWYQILE